VNDHGHQEIIIIKRGNEEEEGHHGGAWKIAFADFMTAMMALFLVLWLINAANEETKRAVASYFNPIKLIDRNRSTKGVEEPKGGPMINSQTDSPRNPEQERSEESPSENPPSKQAQAENKPSDAETDESFFANPMAALDQIEASVLEKNGISNKIETKGEDGMPGKFSDPFNAGYWQEKTTPKPNEAKSADKPDVAEEQSQPATQARQVEPPQKITDSDLSVEAAKLESAVQQEISKSLGENAAVKDAIKVSQTDRGILIQITDLPASPMFSIGNAVPSGETVIAINAIAKALGNTSGKVHIYGHTDSRKFGGAGNGNWRLSANRAQSTYFVLLRAGLAEARFSEISGFADRKPVVPGDPLADQNRRIEIFLESI
jgi:chemotaxis protein MotB